MINDDLKIRAAANREALAARQENTKIQRTAEQAVQPVIQEKQRTRRVTGTLPTKVKRDLAPAPLAATVSASILHCGNGIYTPGISNAELFWDLLFSDGSIDEYADVYYQEGLPELYTLRNNGIVSNVSASAQQLQNNQLQTFNTLTTVSRRNTIRDKKWVHVTAKQLTGGTPNTYEIPAGIGDSLTFYGYDAAVSQYDAFPITLPPTWSRSDTSIDDVVAAATNFQFNSTLVFISGALQQTFYHFGAAESPRVFQHDDPDVSLALEAPGRITGLPPIGYYYSGVNPPGSSIPFNNYRFVGRDAREYTSRPPLSALTSVYTMYLELYSVSEHYLTTTQYKGFNWNVALDSTNYYDTVRSILQNRAKYLVASSPYVNPVSDSATPASLAYRLDKPFWHVGIEGLILPWTFYAVIETKPTPGTAPGYVAWDTSQIAYFWFLYMADNGGTFTPFTSYLDLVPGFPWLVELLRTSVQEVRAFYPKTYLAYLFG